MSGLNTIGDIWDKLTLDDRKRLIRYIRIYHPSNKSLGISMATLPFVDIQVAKDFAREPRGRFINYIDWNNLQFKVLSLLIDHGEIKP